MTTRRKFLAMAAALGIIATCASANDIKKIDLAVYLEFHPYSTFENGEWKGYIIDLTARLLRDPALEPEYNYVVDPPWKRAIRGMENGGVDLLFEVSKRPDRMRFMHFIGETDIEQAFLVTKEDLSINEIKTFDDFLKVDGEIWFNPAISWNAEFDEAIANGGELATKFHTNTSAGTDELDFERNMARLLSYGRVGGYIFSHINVQQVLEYGNKLAAETDNASRLKALPITAFGSSVTFVAASRRLDPSIITILERNYEESRRDGSFDRIWTRWHGSRPPPPSKIWQ